MDSNRNLLEFRASLRMGFKEMPPYLPEVTSLTEKSGGVDAAPRYYVLFHKLGLVLSHLQQAGGTNIHKHRRYSGLCDVSGGSGACGAH